MGDRMQAGESLGSVGADLARRRAARAMQTRMQDAEGRREAGGKRAKIETGGATEALLVEVLKLYRFLGYALIFVIVLAIALNVLAWMWAK